MDGLWFGEWMVWFGEMNGWMWFERMIGWMWFEKRMDGS